MKICLTANSGGHLNQLLQLKEIYKKHDYFFITNNTSFSEELSRSERLYYVEKFIIREIIKKLQLFKPIKNIFQSLAIYLKEKPDLIITTGAGVSLGICVVSKIFFKTIVFIESVARTEEPSMFGKLISKISNKIFVQWEKLLEYYKNGEFSGLIFNLENKKHLFRKNKINRIFVITGTYKLQFNRVLKELDLLKKDQLNNCDIIAQIGASTYRPNYYEYFDFCGQKKIHDLIEKSDLVICQGGSGSIFDSLMRGKKVIAIPRLLKYKEYYDEHQIDLVSRMEKLGLVLAIYDNISELNSMIEKAKTFHPQKSMLKKPQLHHDIDLYISELKHNG